MKISYNEACARDCSTLEQDLELCEKEKFDYIEPRIDMLRAYLKKKSIDDLKQIFWRSQVKPHAINAVYLDRGIPAEDINETNSVMEDFRFACEVGSAIGSHYIIVVPPFDPSGIFLGDIAEAEADCARMLKNLSKFARNYGMNLCFELVGMKKSCIRTVDAANRVIRAVDEDNVGFVFDSCNIYLNNRCNDFSSIEHVQPEKIFAIHLMNIDDVADEQLGQDKRCFVGQGAIDTDAFLQVLKKVGYTGMVSVETFRPQYWEKPAKWVISEAYRTTYEALERNGCL